MNEIPVALAGIGGYGNIYAGALLAGAQEHGVRLVAGIDPAPQQSAYFQTFQETGIPIYPSLESFYREATAGLVIVSTAIHLHAPMTCLALSHGSYVLCEKPLCATLQEARNMMEAERQSGKFVAIGYQWSYSAAIQSLKRDILAGELGRPICLKTIVLWPRPVSYYRRNDWAGRIKTNRGEWVLDSPAHNANAHYLHNMLYLLGDNPETSAWPEDIQAERYRANEIENYDAAALRCHIVVGAGTRAEILFYTAHPVSGQIGPVIHYQFEKGAVEYQAGEAPAFIARFNDGSTRSYGDPGLDETSKLWQSVDAIRRVERVVCGIKAALPELICINGAQASDEIAPFPPSLVHRAERGESDTLVWVKGLQEAFEMGYEQNLLPAELGGIPWAHTGGMVGLRAGLDFQA